MDAKRLNDKINLASLWVFRSVTLLGLAAHLFLVVFSNIRRHKSCGWRRLGVWFAYQVSNWAPPYLLGNLYLEGSPSDKQFFGFWVPFLLLHLARPDNMSGYAMEDNVLAGRVLIFVLSQSVGAVLVVLRFIEIDSTAGTLRPAAWIMLFLGIFKYGESALALRRGKLDSIGSSLKSKQQKNSKKKKFKQQSTSSFSGSARRSVGVDGELLKDEEALLLAHNRLDICKGAFSDCSVDMDQPQIANDLECKNLCKVVEMELSLMYDLLYTKAAMVHTWGGYIIRVMSPPLTAAAFTLFLFRYGDQVIHNTDVDITCILMGTTLVLDVRWLLKAIGSTWTHSFLNGTKWGGLRHALLCSGRWQRLRSRLSWSSGVKKPSSSYRMWARTIGQHNLLRDFRDSSRLCSRLATSIWLQESWNELCYSRVRGLDFSPDEAVRNDLFQRIWSLILTTEDRSLASPGPYDRQAKHWRQRKLDQALGFDPELEEIILIWHIATEVFLCCAHEDIATWLITEKATEIKAIITAIKALSDYMLFLVAVRPGMLPGLKLRSLYEDTRSALNELWDGGHSRNTTGVEKKLAGILRDMDVDTLHGKSIVLSDGTGCAMLMLKRLNNTRFKEIWKFSPRYIKLFTLLPKLDRLCPDLSPWEEDGEILFEMDRMLDLIFDVWLRLLIFASIRCSRDSHAKQLSQGGDLTTIVWMLTQHAGLFSKR